MKRTLGWIDVEIAQSGTTSDAVDLGVPFENLLIYVPTIDNATVTTEVSYDGTTFTAFRTFKDDGTDAAVLAGASTGGYVWRIPFGFQHFKVKAGASQAAKRTFKVFAFGR